MKKTTKPKAKQKGRQPLEITPEQRHQVEVLSGFGLTQDEISDVVGIGFNQVAKYFPTELRRGRVKADAAVLTNLYKIATGSTPQAATAAIFWAKCRRRWHEIQRVIHGFDPEVVTGFVRQLVALLKRELPDTCPHCKTHLGLNAKVAGQLRELSTKLVEKLPPSQIVPLEPHAPGAG